MHPPSPPATAEQPGCTAHPSRPTRAIWKQSSHKGLYLSSYTDSPRTSLQKAPEASTPGRAKMLTSVPTTDPSVLQVRVHHIPSPVSSSFISSSLSSMPAWTVPRPHTLASIHRAARRQGLDVLQGQFQICLPLTLHAVLWKAFSHCRS